MPADATTRLPAVARLRKRSSIMKNRVLVALLPLLSVIGAAAASAPDGKDGPLGCELRTATQNGRTVIEAVVHADRALRGTYRLDVEGGASADSARIRQGGEFDARPGAAETLGRVVLASGGRYEARLRLDAGRLAASCAAVVGGPV